MTGAGTLTLTLDGETVATWTAADGLKTAAFVPAGASAVYRFSFEVPPEQEGIAVVAELKSRRGTVLLFR